MLIKRISALLQISQYPGFLKLQKNSLSYLIAGTKSISIKTGKIKKI